MLDNFMFGSEFLILQYMQCFCVDSVIMCYWSILFGLYA